MKTLDLIREQEQKTVEQMVNEGWNVQSALEVQPYFRTSLISIFEEEVRRLEENRRYTHNSVSIESTPYPAGWNDCLDQQIAHYQELIAELNK